jgi:hypothetical protein
MNEEDLRDCFAMFVTISLVMKDGRHIDPDTVWDIADQILEARKPKDEAGIAAIKPRTRRKV